MFSLQNNKPIYPHLWLFLISKALYKISQKIFFSEWVKNFLPISPAVKKVA